MLFLCYFFTPLQQAFAKHKQPILAVGTEAAFCIPDGWRGGVAAAEEKGCGMGQ